MARPRMFHFCPVCGGNVLYVRNTKLVGHCINRWCECSQCGARIRFVKSNGHGYWIKVRLLQKKGAETQTKD